MTKTSAPFVFTEVELGADDAAARLIAVRATTEPAPWRAAAAAVWTRMVEDFRDDEAHALLEALVESLRPDPDRLFALVEELGAEVHDAYPDHSAALWRAALGVALADPARTERAIELGQLLVRDLIENMDRDAVSAAIGDLVARLPAHACELRVRFFDQLRDGWRTQQLAAEQAREALGLAPDRETRLAILTNLAAMQREASHHAEDRDTWLVARSQVLHELEVVVDDLAPSAAVVRAHLELAADLYPAGRHALVTEPAPSAAQLHHAARADQLSRALGHDFALLYEAARAHAELLVRAGELGLAEHVLATLPGLDDDHLETVGFLEHVRRRLGVEGEPPPEAFVVHDRPEPMFDSSQHRDPHDDVLPDGFAAYFTYDPDPLVMLRAARHAAPEKVREWSYGPVRAEADLESQKIFGPVRDYACACTRYLGARYHGLLCERCGVEVIRAITRTYRPAHVALARPVVHPWYLAPLATALDTTEDGLREQAPDELRDRLRCLDTTDAAARARASHSGQAKLPVLEAFRVSLIRPEWLLLDVVPVWAPAAALPAGVDRAKLRAAYLAMLDPDPRRGVAALFACFER